MERGRIDHEDFRLHRYAQPAQYGLQGYSVHRLREALQGVMAETRPLEKSPISSIFQEMSQELATNAQMAKISPTNFSLQIRLKTTHYLRRRLGRSRTTASRWIHQTCPKTNRGPSLNIKCCCRRGQASSQGRVPTNHNPHNRFVLPP